MDCSKRFLYTVPEHMDKQPVETTEAHALARDFFQEIQKARREANGELSISLDVSRRSWQSIMVRSFDLPGYAADSKTRSVVCHGVS